MPDYKSCFFVLKISYTPIINRREPVVHREGAKRFSQITQSGARSGAEFYYGVSRGVLTIPGLVFSPLRRCFFTAKARRR